MREWLARLRDWLRRGQLDRELAEELRFHRDRLAEDATAAGLEPVEASHLARRRLGNLPRLQEAVRDRWSWPWLEHFLNDVRYALRNVRRSPGFAGTVILTLGLGIGANAVMFGVIDRLMFRPFPYLRDPGTVHRAYWRSWDRGTLSTRSWTEYPRFLALKRRTTSFSQYAGFANRIMAIGLGDASRERLVAMVSASFFDFFDARPALGRFFAPDEDVTPRGADVAVLGYAFWMSEFGGRDVRGQILQVHHIPARIVGVAPRGFAGVNDNDGPAVYIPITTYAGAHEDPRRAATYFANYTWAWMEVMVRRKPGVSLAQASADLSRAAVVSWNARRAVEPWLPAPEVARPSAVASALKLEAGPDRGLYARTALWVTGVAVIVLLIACANVTNLYLAKALQHRREIALRLALGVSRSRLLTQTVTESLVLSGLGGAAGLLVAQWGGSGVGRLLTSDEGGPLAVATDWRTLSVAIGIAAVLGVLTGLVPALLSGRGDLTGALKAGARAGTYHHSRARAALLLTQGALSVFLLVGAGLFVQSLARARAMPLGYEADRVLLGSRVLRGMSLDDNANARLGRTLLATAQAMPGVEYASWVSTAPFWITNSTRLFVPGIDSVERLGRFTYQTATADYFRTMGTRIVRGRGFVPEDGAGAPRIAVISQGMADALWPGREALGQCMRVWADTLPCTTVVGIAEDIVQGSLRETQRFHYYLPLEQFTHANGLLLLLRMRGDPAVQSESVRQALQAAMPGLSYVTVRPLSNLVHGAQRSLRLGATMFVAFGVLALVVAAVGLYGVIAYDVAQRKHELGVRIALGAQPRDVVRLVAGQGVRLAAAGVLVGSGLALAASRWIQPLLFQQSARDPTIYGLVGAVLLTAALLASAIPALRATRADANAALRSE